MTTNTDGAMPELPENIREGAPYDNARFEELCREHDIWGTAESAMCAVFWRTAIQQAAGAVPEGPTPREWRTIETAPTHVDVLACNPCGFVGRAYKDSKGRWNHIGNPTHWMPLPAAPTKGYQHLEEREAYDRSMRGFFNADGTPLPELAALNEKWKFVPVVPTEEMLTAAKGGAVFDQTMESLYRKGLLKNWADMLAASPSPPKQQPVHLVGGEGGGVTQWRSIETAPRDGLLILGRAATASDPAISTSGFWAHAYPDGVDEMGHDGGFIDCSYEVFTPGRSFGAESYQTDGFQPTHWKPFPTPPEGNSK